jgi:Phospholipase_D-nuclease N-terminal
MMESLLVVFMFFFIANLVLVIWSLIDAIKVPDDSMFEAGTKLIWVLVIVFTGFIGSIISLAVGRPSHGGRTAVPPLPDPNRPPPPPPVALG